MRMKQEKHTAPLPTPRSIRRACDNELYRTLKRLKHHVPAEKVKEAVELYYKRVIGRLEWVTLNHSNRTLLADWWDEAVCKDIAALWEVDPVQLSKAFRDAFGG
ncbi:dehydrogenase [Cohnella sp. CFH 77786]|uniref:dehydrogenase n=1 Tax=Cohnella sp. CFH 77786 TaxID=2662265 RepID=UPI001C60E76B|nr:dehydrogenase [Cohnella sp. CFH 77786]MBW5447905.1 dehydrogenase [Cohnella sp. CFH 77786]